MFFLSHTHTRDDPRTKLIVAIPSSTLSWNSSLWVLIVNVHIVSGREIKFPSLTDRQNKPHESRWDFSSLLILFGDWLQLTTPHIKIYPKNRKMRNPINHTWMSSIFSLLCLFVCTIPRQYRLMMKHRQNPVNRKFQWFIPFSLSWHYSPRIYFQCTSWPGWEYIPSPTNRFPYNLIIIWIVVWCCN